MKKYTDFRAGWALIGLAAAIPASAVSLSSTSPPQPLPANEVTSAPIENWSAGSASLVPLMAADIQPNRIHGVEAPAANEGGAVGKPVDDVVFVTKATESGTKEIAAARDALPKLKNPELKRMAEMLVKDHTSANAKLSKIAQTKGWPVPAPRTDAPPPPTGAASGDFEQKWTAEMIAGHERSVSLYRAQAQGGDDKDLRQFASDTLPTIEHHLSELRKLQK
jgi:putative membrane protein